MRWRKVLGDLRQYRLSLALIALVLAFGIAGVVAALNAQAILKREIATSFAAAKAPDLALWFDRVDAPLLARVAAREDVAAVDARRVLYTRIEAKDGTWLPARLVVRRDGAAQALGVVHRHGSAPPDDVGGIFLEQSGEPLVAARPGGRLSIRKPGGEVATLDLAGFVHDPGVAPSTQERMLYGYVAPAAAAHLGHGAVLDQLLVKMTYRGSTREAVDFGAELAAALGREGAAPLRVEALPAGHPHAGLMNAMLRVLGVLSAIAFTCSAALAGYLVSAWMRREVRVVGILKTLGARSGQIAAQYLALAGPLALAALAAGLAAGIALGRVLVAFYADNLNIDIALWDAPRALLLQQVAFALGIPLLAMTLPIVRAARMTPRAAIQDAGIAAPTGPVRAAAFLVRLPGRMRWTYALRNAWRRPWRLLFMVVALASGGALLLVTRTNYESLMGVVDASLASQGHDVEVLLQRAAPAAELVAIARAVPEVEVAEAWRRASLRLADPGAARTPAVEHETSRFTLVGHPQDSRLFTLPVVNGRSPRPGAVDEVLVTRTLQDPHPDLQLGRTVEVQFRERRAPVRVVGLVEQIGMPVMYAPFPVFEAITALGDSAASVRARARPGAKDLVANAIDQAFLDARRTPAQVISRSQVREALEEHFKVVGEVMRFVALAVALVGAIVLAAATALNVLERLRETGILRALGASSRDVAGVFVIEGLAITFASFVLAIGTSLLLSRAILDAAERSLLRVAVPLRFSLEGLWQLGAGALVVALAAWLAVRLASRRSAREALAFE